MAVYLETMTDIQNLVSVMPYFQDDSSCVFLDSAKQNDDMSRYSYLSADPFLVIQSTGNQISITQNGITNNISDNPWRLIKKLLIEYQDDTFEFDKPFTGGAIGYWSYDLGRMVEKLPEIAVNDCDYSEMWIGFYDWVLIHDHHEDLITLSTTTSNPQIDYKERQQWVKDRILESNLKVNDAFSTQRLNATFKSNFSINDYIGAVEKVKSYLKAGDIYQANISQRFSTLYDGDPWKLYLNLRDANPAPFSAYLNLPEICILSASPELFLSLDGQRVETRPIKGTRPTSEDKILDDELANELVNSEKDRAENVMIVDLMRSDLGKVCEIGSVSVTGLWTLERHPTVWHLVSRIEGKLKENYGAIDLLEQCFPGGSITGAPKIRAMEIIEEVEPMRRGLYCGSIGYIGFNGSMRTNIAIRTMTITKNNLLFHGGGGIVADSDPLSEYQETLDKAKGLMRALEINQ